MLSIQPEILPHFTDARGSVCEPLDAEVLSSQRNVHVVLSHPGQIRGNHLHRESTETMVVYGPALVRLRQADQTADFAVPAGEIHRFVVPAGVAHAIQNTGSGPGLIVSFATRRHDPQQPDTWREVLIHS